MWLFLDRRHGSKCFRRAPRVSTAVFFATQLAVTKRRCHLSRRSVERSASEQNGRAASIPSYMVSGVPDIQGGPSCRPRLSRRRHWAMRRIAGSQTVTESLVRCQSYPLCGADSVMLCGHARCAPWIQSWSFLQFSAPASGRKRSACRNPKLPSFVALRR